MRAAQLTLAASQHTPRVSLLGLQICRSLLRPMGSDLDFETRTSRGTCFHFDLGLPLTGESDGVMDPRVIRRPRKDS
jgi:K+-sensing histidine kinase KdpD